MIRALALVVARLPRRWLGLPGAMLGFLAGTILRIRRRDVTRAMERAGVPDAADAMYRGLGRGVFELLWLAGATPARREEAVASVRFDDDLADALDRAARDRRGVVLGVSHTANWELAAGATAAFFAARGGARVAVVAKRQSVGVFDAFCMNLRRQLGVRVIVPRAGEVARAVLGALEAGDAVAMPIDQVPDRARHGIAAPFLGASALVDRAPFALAARAEAPMLVVGCRREPDGSVAAELLDTFEPARGKVDAHARSATRALDAFVRRHPAAWLWLHRRWRQPRFDSRRLSPLRIPANHVSP